MSNFLKPMGYLAALAATAGAAGCSPAINEQGVSMTVLTQDGQSAELPRAPLKIPMPLDKAGARVDVTFEVPPPPKGWYAWSYFIGLRVPFTPGTSTVREALQAHPVAARMFLWRIKDGEEVRIPLFSRAKRPAPGQPLRIFDPVELFDGEAVALISAAEHTDDPPGTPDASTLVMSLASGKGDGYPGVYRLQFELLEDIPELSGMTSFLVYEETRQRRMARRK